jgi:hypothetical protein
MKVWSTRRTSRTAGTRACGTTSNTESLECVGRINLRHQLFLPVVSIELSSGRRPVGNPKFRRRDDRYHEAVFSDAGAVQRVTHVIGIKRYRCVQNGPLGSWWKGRESNPRPRHYECRPWSTESNLINHLPRASVARYPHRAELSRAGHAKVPQQTKLDAHSLGKQTRLELLVAPQCFALPFRI